MAAPQFGINLSDQRSVKVFAETATSLAVAIAH